MTMVKPSTATSSASSSSRGEESCSCPSSIETTVFDSFGILEYILSYSDVDDLLVATLVNRRWKDAGRTDSIWESAIEKLWKKKMGTPKLLNCGDGGCMMTATGSNGSPPPFESPTSLLFWRSLFTKDAVRRMTAVQIRTIFQHPLLSEKKDILNKKGITEKPELQRFLQVHMLDVMSDGVPEWHHFFSDIYFGSYACSVLDAKRDSITTLELCTPHGFDMYFKIATDDVDDADRAFLMKYDEGEGMLLYHHSTCFFEESREFSIVLKQYVQSYHPTDLRWRWLDVGKRVQVGPYPPLTVSRRKDWGWKLENLHVVLLFRDKK